MSFFRVIPSSSIIIAGGATEAKQDVIIAELADIEAELVSANLELIDVNGELVDVNSELDNIASELSLDYVAKVRNSYASTNVTTGAWVELIASTTGAVKQIEIFDSSGQTLEIGIGAAGLEVSKVFVFPGGNGRIPLIIPAASRVAIRAVSATASVGEIAINLYG